MQETHRTHNLHQSPPTGEPTIPTDVNDHPHHQKQKLRVPPLIVIGTMIITAAFIARAQTLDTTIQETPKKLSISPPVSLTPTVTPSPTPTPYPLPQGKQEYKISHSKSILGPKVTNVSIDPFDPKVGEKQEYILHVLHNAPLSNVLLSLQTDNKIATISLEKKEETEKESTWRTTIVTDDTHLYVYYAQFILRQNGQEYAAGLTFRAY